MAQKKKQDVRTVKGIASWCKPFTPDYKFKTEGEFSTKLIITEEAKSALEEVFNPLLDAIYEEVISKSKKPEAARKQLKAVSPFKPELNEETGEHTGNYVLHFKRPAKFVNKTTGEEWPQSIPVYIAKNKLAPKGFQIGNGSEIVVAYTLNGSKDYENPGYFVASSKEVGISFRLEAISVLKHVEYSGSANPFADTEFGEEGDAFGDDGYAHDSASDKGTDDDDSPF